MPLPSLLNGAKQCQVTTRRTKQRCKNPAAYGCLSCRMHGAHQSRNVLQGEQHPRYKTGERTKLREAEHRKASILLLTLRDLGDSIGMFIGKHTAGRKPNDYIKISLETDQDLIKFKVMINELEAK